MTEKREEVKGLAVVRPGEAEGGNKPSSLNPDLVRYDAIKVLMGGRATLARISKEQIILESVLSGCIQLGYELPCTMLMVQSARELSPGLDGLGRGEAVKCLVAHAQQAGSFYPASAFPADNSPGFFARLWAMVTGKKNQENQ